MWSCLSVAGQGLVGVERFVANLFTVEGDVVVTLCLSIWCDRIRACMGASRRGHLQYCAQVAWHPSNEVCRRFFRGGQVRRVVSEYYVAAFLI